MELLRSTSRGGFSVRGILTFAMAVVITALLWATFGSSTPSHAVESPATWKGDSLLYNTHQYFPLDNAQKAIVPALPEGTKVYAYIQDIDTSAKTYKAFIIYFSSGTDPPKETSATLAEYTYTAATKTFTGKTNEKTIDVTPKGNEDSYSSCNVEGIGWIVCPIAVFLADGMDQIFTIVAGFMAVQPPTVGDTNNSLFIAWNIMRSIANVAFIIVFLIIIYSQITNLAVSNYGLKKLLPRLIVAAVLVNLSYLIATVAVDISNILGYSLQDIFVSIRQDTFAITDDTWSAATVSWTEITATILSGGAIGVAGIALAGDPIGAIYVVLPLLVGLILTILFVLLILAARQAIIVILIIVAPLAFVAYLLPNTEQWFKRWRELFTTMLIFFPAFSLVFGGSQLAGGLIIQNATSVFMIVFGLAVQVAPLIITPLILKFSGGVLGKIAGMVNDPRKGLLDRTKNWSKARQDMRRMQSLRKTGTVNPFRKAAQFLDNNSQNVKNRTAQYTTENDNRYRETKGYKKIYEGTHHAETAKKGVDARLERGLNEKIASNSHLFEEELKIATDIDQSENAKIALENALKEAKAGAAPQFGPQTAQMTRLLENAKLVTKKIAAEKSRTQAADSEIQKMIAESFNVVLKADESNRVEFVASQALLRTAGGIQGSVGITRARSNATAALAKIEAEAVDNNVKLLTSEALLKGTTLKIHTKQIYDDVMAGRGAQYEKSVIEAALEAQAQDGQISLVEAARGSVNFDQSTVAKIIARNIGTMKEKGGFHLQADPNLNIEYFLEKNAGNLVEAQKEFTTAMNLSRIASLGDTSANQIGGLKAGWLEDMQELLTGGESDAVFAAAKSDPKARAALEATFANFDLALRNEQVRATIGDRIPQVQDIRDRLMGELGIPPRDDSQTPPSTGA